MFTWIPFYEELGSVILSFRDKQDKLISFLEELEKVPLPVINLKDTKNGNDNLLNEIDPFTFFANFNRGIKDQNRIESLRFLKEKMEIKADLPSDFMGIPVVDKLQSLFFPFKDSRDPGDINALWDLAEAAVNAGIEGIREEIFNRCLEIKSVGLPKLTIGLFWLRPKNFMPFDKRSRKFLEHKGLIFKVDDFKSYFDFVQQVHAKTKKEFYEISHEAYLGTQGEKFWQIAPGEDGRLWDNLKANSIAAVGWDELNIDLTNKSKEEIRNLIKEQHPDHSENKRNFSTTMLSNFVNLKLGDKFVTNKGKQLLLALGTVKKPYQFKPERKEYKHTVEVDYYEIPERDIPIPENLKGKFGKTIIPLKKEDFETIEKLFHRNDPPPEIEKTSYPMEKCSSETGMDIGILKSWIRGIERKGQAVIYGPPGTGKTFVAERLAKHLISGGQGFVDLVQFHPAYAYEDFVQGIRPQPHDGGGLDYPVMAGRFLDFCEKAMKHKGRCVLIIDEINRTNLARVFGELMYLLEYRNREIPLAGGGSLHIPNNVRIIGTMNTADRSIALVDHALRRRFAFLALYPNYQVLEKYHKTTEFNVAPLINVLTKLNKEINDRHYEVGISFFLREDLRNEIEDIWRMEIEPYLEEYFFDPSDQEKMEAFRWGKVEKEIIE